MEDRILLDASVQTSVTNNVLNIAVSDVSTDTSTVVVQRKSSDSTSADYNQLEVSLNGTAQSTTCDLSSLTGIQLQAGAGTDTLKVDEGNGALNLPVTFLAGSGNDSYSDTAASMSGVLSGGKVVLGDQLNTQLSNLQTLINNNVYNQPLPVVATTDSNNLKDVGQADILGTFSTSLQNALDNTSTSNPGGLASSAGPADIQKALYAALGPSGAQVLQTRPGDSNTTPGLNDVVVVANNGTFSYEMSLAQQNSTCDTGTLLDFNPGLAGLPLTLGTQSQQAVQTQFGFSYDFKFDIASSAAASIDNSTTSSNPLLIGLNARLAPGYEDTGATLGLLNADITDGPQLSLVPWGDGSGVPTSGKNLVIVGIDNNNLLHIRIFDATGVQVTDANENQLPAAQAAAIATLKQQLPGLMSPHALTTTEKAQVIGEVESITGQNLSTTLNAQYHVTFGGSGNGSTVSATVSGAANFGLHMVLSVMPNSLGPDSLTGGSNTTGDSINLKFFADMAGTWNLGPNTAPVPMGPLTSLGSQPKVSFGVSMDANSFFQNFVKPIVTDDILPEFSSVQPLVDVLDYKVPLLNFGLDDVMDNAALAPIGNYRGFFQSIHTFQLLAQDLANFPTVVGTVDLGSFSIAEDARVKTYGPNSNDYVSILPGDVTAPATDPLTQMRNLVSDPAHLIQGLSSQDHSLDVVGGTLQLSNDDVNFFDMINMSIQFGLGVGFQNVTFNLLQFPMLSSPVNIFNTMMNHQETLLTWDTAPAALNVQNTFSIPTDKEIPGGAIELTPQISFLAHFAGGFDTHGLQVSDPNQGFYLTDADPAEADRADISTIVDQFTTNPNTFQSTFMALTVAFSVDAGFSTDAILAEEGEPSISDLGTSFSVGIGITFAGHIIWKPDDPDTDTLSAGLETAFSDRTHEQQVMRPDEILNEIQNCGGTIWVESGNLTFGFNIVVSLKILYIPILSKTINLVSFKIADFNTPPCAGMSPPPLAHMGDPNNQVSGPYADANPSNETAGTLYLNTATAQPANNADTSQDDTIIIKALSNNADGTDNLLVISQGRSEEYDNVKAIYADGGGGNDSFIVKPGVTVSAVIHDGNGNDHLEYDGSGNASLYAGNGTNTLIGGTGNNILVSGNGNSTLVDHGPGTDSITVGDGDNTILGGSGTQTITVGNGNNNIEFGSGDSTITLGTGANTITGRIKEGHVKIFDASSADTDHTDQGLADQLILNGTTNPDNVYFSTGTLNSSPAVEIDDGTASSSWSVTAQNINTITYNGGGNSGAIGRNGDNITVGDLSSTGVAALYIDPNHGQTPNQQKDALTVLGTPHDDNIAINEGVPNPDGSSTTTVTGLEYSVNINGMEPAYDTLTVNGNGGNDALTGKWAQDFNGTLNLLGFQKTALTVGRDFNGTLSDTQPGTIQQVTIGHALTSTGQLTAGNITSMTIGPDMLTPGDDMAGQINVLGTLGDLRVAGGTPGSITAGHVGTVRAYGGYGPVVLQINEAGIERRVEAAVPGMDYPLPPAPATSVPVSPTGVTFQYYYESGSLANPQLTMRVSNSSPRVDQYDLSLVTYNDAAKFNLARLDAAGASGIRNVAIEGDVLTTVSNQAANFFQVPGANRTTVPDSSPAGIYLPQDHLAGVGVRDFLPNASIHAASIQAVAFGSFAEENGRIETGAAASGEDAADTLAAGTAIVQSTDTYRVPFADLPTQQVRLFLVNDPRGGHFSDQGISFAVQCVSSPNAAGTANVVTPSNVARGAVTALVTMVPTYDKKGHVQNSVVQEIDLRGDGGSIRTGQSFSATGSITSTGPLGDLTLQESQGLYNLTAPSIFGSILITGPITGIAQTTGLRTDPITGSVTMVAADLGRLYVDTSGKVPIVTSTTIQTGGISGELVSRGDLISELLVNGSGITGVVAVQGNLGKLFTPSGQTAPLRLGGLASNGPFSGDLVVLGQVIADMLFNGGLKGGRIAVEGGIAGNLTINGGIDAQSVLVSGGAIGDASAGTHLVVNGAIDGILAAIGTINFGKPPHGGNIFNHVGANPNSPNTAAIDAIFAESSFDVSGLDLLGLDALLANLRALHVKGDGNLVD